jgi:hypothetical protein
MRLSSTTDVEGCPGPLDNQLAGSSQAIQVNPGRRGHALLAARAKVDEAKR